MLENPDDGGHPPDEHSLAGEDATAFDDPPTEGAPGENPEKVIPGEAAPQEVAEARCQESTDDESSSGDWPQDAADEIEEAYQKALAAIDDASWVMEGAERLSDALRAADETQVAASAVAGEVAGDGSGAVAGSAAADPTPMEVEPGSRAGDRVEETPPGPRLAHGTERPPRSESEEAQVTPSQVIEAALFVGGGPLTAKKLCALLRGGVEVAAVETMIDDLNERYRVEARPYEIRLGDGGYRLELRPEFERLRQRVYGAGPREVKLSQEVLEILALVAYRQPISHEEVEAHGKQNPGGPLRQLLRRDLVALQRGDGGRKDVRYVTTPRFLQVFGLSNLQELPEPEDLVRK